ncbi:transmembrane protein 192 [Euwallacea fornicatus]|uniref:transmembrane protein 192 n=1 Tax=Euwallacea fornicatus TaxID=995702 RepID=UPI00338FF24D
MVSLSRSFNTNFGGATFFSESVNMADLEQLLPVLDSFRGFKPVRTTPLFGFHLLVTFVLDILIIVYAGIHPDPAGKCREYYLIMYLHVVLWFLTLLLHLITKHIHHNVRLMGYLEFYKKVECHGSLPLVVVSLWTVALLFIQTVMQHFYLDNFVEKCLNGGILSPKAYICLLITVEFCVLAGVNVTYIVKVISFNKKQAPPDVIKSEWVSSGNPDTFTQNEVGYREIGNKVYEFLEKQADLIRYLKEHNAKLAEKVMLLNSQLKNVNPGTSAGSINTS